MTASPAPSPSADPFADLGARVDEISSRVVDRRRYLHERPELSFQESETSAFIVAELERIGGFAEISRPTPTSVVADLRGGLPGPRIAVRSDHDALPIEEATGLPFASKNPGVMHACGHDGHTSMMLGVAEVLAPLADSLTGEVRFLFEHGEEALPGGASQMVAAGAMEGVDRVLGQHLWAWFPLGKVSVRPGPVMASCDVFEIVVNGARRPHLQAPGRDRPARDRRADRHQPPAPRRPRGRSAGDRGGRRDPVRSGRVGRRDPADGAARRRHQHVQRRGPRPARAADRRDRRGHLRRPRRHLRLSPTRAATTPSSTTRRRPRSSPRRRAGRSATRRSTKAS